MEFAPNVDDFYPEDAINDSTQDYRRRQFSRVKKVGNLWVTSDGETFEKEHKAYKAINEQTKQLEFLYVDPTLKIEQFFDLDLPLHISSNFKLNERQTAEIKKRSFKQGFE